MNAGGIFNGGAGADWVSLELGGVGATFNGGEGNDAAETVRSGGVVNGESGDDRVGLGRWDVQRRRRHGHRLRRRGSVHDDRGRGHGLRLSAPQTRGQGLPCSTNREEGPHEEANRPHAHARRSCGRRARDSRARARRRRLATARTAGGAICGRALPQLRAGRARRVHGSHGAVRRVARRHDGHPRDQPGAHGGRRDPRRPARDPALRSQVEREPRARRCRVLEARRRPEPRTNDDRPSLFGRAFEGPMPGHGPVMPVHYDMHAWVAEENPSGLFALFNPALSCLS